MASWRRDDTGVHRLVFGWGLGLPFLRLSETDAEGKRRQSKIYGRLRGQIMGIFGMSTFGVLEDFRE